MASLCMQAGQFVFLPPWGTIKIVDLQREHCSTAKTTPPRVIMSPETRNDYLSSWCNGEPHAEAERSWLHKKMKCLGMNRQVFRIYGQSENTHKHTHTHTHLQHPSVILINIFCFTLIKVSHLCAFKKKHMIRAVKKYIMWLFNSKSHQIMWIMSNIHHSSSNVFWEEKN